MNDELMTCEICETIDHEDNMNYNDHYALCDDCHEQETYERNIEVRTLTAHYAKLQDVDFYNDGFEIG